MPEVSQSKIATQTHRFPRPFKVLHAHIEPIVEVGKTSLTAGEQGDLLDVQVTDRSLQSALAATPVPWTG